ncbi:TlpA family protein disulfide reductase [Actinocatenispora sera]|nr:TlpA disulfide reductase family protein [Actinocatenispora sera]
MTPARPAGRRRRTHRPAGPAGGGLARRLLLPGVMFVLLAVAAGCGDGGGSARHGDGGSARHPATPSAGASGAAAAWFAACPAPRGPATGTPKPPAVTLSCAHDGRSVPIARAYGKPTVINLWASWCGPCRQELPQIQAYARTHPDVVVLTVDTRDTEAAGLSFARAAGVRLPTLYDPKQQLLAGVHRAALPTTLLLRADGSLAYTYNSTALTADSLAALVQKELG